MPPAVGMLLGLLLGCFLSTAVGSEFEAPVLSEVGCSATLSLLCLPDVVASFVLPAAADPEEEEVSPCLGRAVLNQSGLPIDGSSFRVRSGVIPTFLVVPLIVRTRCCSGSQLPGDRFRSTSLVPKSPLLGRFCAVRFLAVAHVIRARRSTLAHLTRHGFLTAGLVVGRTFFVRAAEAKDFGNKGGHDWVFTRELNWDELNSVMRSNYYVMGTAHVITRDHGQFTVSCRTGKFAKANYLSELCWRQMLIYPIELRLPRTTVIVRTCSIPTIDHLVELTVVDYHLNALVAPREGEACKQLTVLVARSVF
nr:hypothetical protein CFP56_02928 [Quercus suber]